MTSHALASSLDAEDAEALSKSAHDVSDLDPRIIQRVRAGFRHAYQEAQRISEGSLDPLSAP